MPGRHQAEAGLHGQEQEWEEEEIWRKGQVTCLPVSKCWAGSAASETTGMV